MSLENMPDERLLAFYENIREQADADRAHKHQFMGPTVRWYCATRWSNDGYSTRLSTGHVTNALPIFASQNETKS